jgi:hypothetical protein
MKRVAVALGIALGVYLVGRAIVELLTLDFGNPAAYRHDWGGPSLAGVLAVHCGPGLVAAVLLALAAVRRRRRLARREPAPGPP